MPETFLLLSNDFDIRQQAQKLNVPARSITEMRQLVRQRISVMDDRASQGELERDFPMKKLRKNGTVNGDSHTVLRESASTNGYELGVDALLATVEDNKNLKTNITEERGTIGILDILNVKPKEIVSPVEVPVAYNVSAPLSRTPPLEISYAKETTDKLDDNPSTPLDVVGVLTDKTISTIHEPALAIKVIQDNEKVQEPVPILLPLPEDKKASPPEVKEDSDSDDEEMIVFKPKSRPSSGLPKVTVESSRPKTADSTKKIPNTAAIDKSIKTRIPTQLKPQSPVFVPRNLASPIVVPSQLRHQAPGTAPGPSVPTAPVQATAPTMAKLQTASVVQTQSTRQVHDPAQPPTHHHTRVHKPQQIRSEGLVQRQGREIIERQREAINRQAQASPKVSPKPPPRQIQMQPTSSPTVIDPDAFDRSYVVQPRNPNASNGTNGNHREDSGRGSPRRERVPKTPEPDLDYILKSGAPRGSTRGRGKLWVP
ncbi:hypothetical protein MMC19_000933 [Ptychographa xylographoides]|nr:hypothetical protein [Ptychographa xylographoides]